jgi:uncharacterized repeat protein (TIGR01451 family)
MKRTLVACAVLTAVSLLAFHPPEREPLPNFDQRLNDPAAAARLTAAEDKAITSLHERVPQLQVSRSTVLGRPSFFSSRASFLTGPAASGLAVSEKSASSIPASDRHRAVKAFINEHASLVGFNAAALDSARISREYVSAHNGLRTVVWQQELNGVAVFEAITMGHITRDGELVNLYTHFVGEPEAAAAAGMKAGAAKAAASPRLSAAEALALGAANIGESVSPAALVGEGQPEGARRKQTFRGAGGLKGDQYAELMWLPINERAMRLCWQVIVSSRTRGEMYLLLVDVETGDVLVRRCLTNYISDATYHVFPSDSPSPLSPGNPAPGNPTQPPVVNRTAITLPAFNTNASPNGWINDGVNETIGNNVDAHSDRNDDDRADLPRPQGNPNRVFNPPLDLAQDPTNHTAAAVVNLFYWNNLIHDKLWALGFTEAAGNFQSTNFGRGGLGDDPVFAQAQDGADFKDIFHVDNANMATPPDGFPPRMQMYVFSGPNPDRDGDFDAEIIIHEYVHGLSNRRVGGGIGISSLQTAGMGEGWSDFYALCLLSETSDALDGNYAMGGYATYQLAGLPYTDNYYFGIRHFPYATNLLRNPLTFKDIDPRQISSHPGVPRSPVYPFNPNEAAQVHHQGEVWCSMLWEVRANLITRYGAATGNQLALQLVTDGMALCPPNPNFVQARDGILAADRVNNNGANYAQIWAGFAKRGLGATATSPDSSTTRGVVESFDLPGLQITSVAVNDGVTGNGNASVDVNECVDLAITLRNNGLNPATSVSATILSLTPGVTVVQGSSSFPTLPPNGSGANVLPFRIYTTPSFICGTPVELSLRVSSLSPGLQVSTNIVRLRSGFVDLSPAYRNNNSPVAIPDANTNGVESLLNVSGFDGALGKVNVSLHLTHTYVGDLRVELISPEGIRIALSRNQGGRGTNFGVSCSPFSARTTFDDNAPQSLAQGNAPYVGVYRPDEPLDVLTGKSGVAINGTWRLRVVDTFAQDVGTLQCWSLALYPTVCAPGSGPCASDVGVSVTALPQPAVLGGNLTYSLNLTNHRGFDAAAVTLTSSVPAGLTISSVSSSQGGCGISNGLIRCDLGTIASRANASVTIVAQPSQLGSVTNRFGASTVTFDSDTANNSATLVVSVVEPAPVLVAAGAQLTAESWTPINGGIDAGEQVTVNLSLRNNGTTASGNLVATLLETGGVSASSGSANYGSIAVGETGTATFTFAANVVAGAPLTATLQLQDGVKNLGTVSFQFRAGGEVAFGNTAAITINQFGTATPYPSSIQVSGVTGLVSRVRVTLTKLSHTFPDDIDALLVGPRGQKLVLMSDSGGGNALVSRTLTFDAFAAAHLSDEGVITSGEFLPSNFVSGTEPSGDIFPAPAPVGALASSLHAYNLTDANGTWSLFIHDDGGNDSGTVAGGWSLGISTVSPVNAVADVGVSLGVSPNPVLASEPTLLTFTVVNNGPSNATSVVLSNRLPANASVGSATSSHGVANVAGGVLTANIGTLASGASATVTVSVTPLSTGSITNVASVTSASTDLNAANNSLTAVQAVNAPSADLALVVVATPQTIFVSSNAVFTAVITNRGPNRAHAVRFTNTPSAGFNFVSVTNSQGGCSFSNGVVTCELGSLAAQGSATVTLTANAQAAGTFTNIFGLAQLYADPAVSNNVVTLSTTVSPLAPLIVASGVALLQESGIPANTSLDPAETVRVSFGLRNMGTLPTENLVATLAASGGVTLPSGSVNFGALVPGGTTVSRAFDFVVANTPGAELTATLQLQDGARNLGSVTFDFSVSASGGFTNNNVIIIPNSGQANTYPSTLNVSGVTGLVTKVKVHLRQFSHSFPEDVDILLVGPAGQKVLLMSDAGAGTSVSGLNLTFDDGAASLLGSAAITSGSFRPTDYAPGDAFPSPAPSGPFAANLSVFNGLNPNGAWSLFVFDDAAGDAGRVDGGWALEFQTAAPVLNAADLQVAVSAPPTSASGAAFTYNFSVVNYGPASAQGVVLNSALPTGFQLGAVTTSQGNFVTAPNLVTVNLGSLNAGATATVTISGAGVGPATLSNVVTASSALVDANVANNLAIAVTAVTGPDLVIRRSGTNAIISWLSPATGFALEASTNAQGPFSASGLTPQAVNGTNQVVTPVQGSRFFRLRKP